jgi:hypothetical protein
MNLPMDNQVKPTTTLCTICEENVTVAQNGRVLTPKPSPFGVLDPIDGEGLTVREHHHLLTTTGTAGHSPHRCPTGQAALFDAQEASA